jgi:hypothetical protein
VVDDLITLIRLGRVLDFRPRPYLFRDKRKHVQAGILGENEGEISCQSEPSRDSDGDGATCRESHGTGSVESVLESKSTSLLECKSKSSLESKSKGWADTGIGTAASLPPTVRDLLIESGLKIRNKRGALVPLKLNRAQRRYSESCTSRNIVLKARQLGITTYVAARFFIETVTRPGTLTVQVAHTQDSAEEIFRMVHRFWENLPEGVRKGALIKSRSNIRQIVFPRLDSEYRVATAADENAGRGLTIQNLHCSEVARWPRNAAETLAALRAAVPPHGNVVLEDRFKAGLGKVIDGTVDCLNASIWAKKPQ